MTKVESSAIRWSIGATRLVVRPTGITLSNGDGPAETELRMLSVRSFPPRFALWNVGSLIGDLYQGNAAVPLPVPALPWACHVLDPETTRNWAYLKACACDDQCHELHGALPPGPAGTQSRLGHRVEGVDDGQQLVDLYQQIVLFAQPQGGDAR
jgi:conjugal transfer ATP-binding protein TraC